MGGLVGRQVDMLVDWLDGRMVGWSDGLGVGMVRWWVSLMVGWLSSYLPPAY